MAVIVGQVLAVLLALYGFLGGGLILILVAIFIFFGAQGEGGVVEVQPVLGGLRVKHVVNTGVHTVRRDQTLGELAARLFHTYQEDFPVLQATGRWRVCSRATGLSPNWAATAPTTRWRSIHAHRLPGHRLGGTVNEALDRMRTGGFKAIP